MRGNLSAIASHCLAGLSLWLGATIFSTEEAAAAQTNQPLQSVTNISQPPNPAHPVTGGIGNDADTKLPGRSLPGSWQIADIAAVAAPGSVICRSNSFTVMGSGVGIADTQSLTNLSQLLKLNREGIQESYPVRLEGVVVYADPSAGLVALQDQTRTGLVECESIAEGIQPGQRVRVEGVARISACPVVKGPAFVDNDGLHGTAEKQNTRFFKAGRHPMRVEWFNGTQDAVLFVDMEGPDFPRQRVPDDLLFHEETDATTGKSNQHPGLKYSYYEGDWSATPNFDRLTPIKSGVVTNFDLGVSVRKEYVGIVFQGLLEIPKDGDYTLTLASDDGSRLVLNRSNAVLTVIGKAGKTPEARRLVPGQVLPSDDESQWSSVEGMVSFVNQKTDSMEMELTAQSGKMWVEVMGPRSAMTDMLSRSRIRVKGISEIRRTTDGLIAAGKLFVPSLDLVEIIEVAPQLWRRHPLMAITHLVANPPLAGTVGHVKGAFRRDAINGMLLVHDGTGEVSFVNAEPPHTNATLIEVLGVWQKDRLALRNAVYRPWTEVSEANTNSLPLLTKIEQIHNLSRTEAAKLYPARVRGVVTGDDRSFGGGAGVVQDEGRGIYYSMQDGLETPKLGEFVEFEGVSDPADFAPMLLVNHMTRLGMGSPPEPVRPTWDQLANGSMDCQYTELRGVISQVLTNEILMLMHGGEWRVNTGLPDETLMPYIGALIRLRGCYTAAWNPETHQVSAGCSMRSSQLHCEAPAPTDVFAVPARSIPEMWQFSLESSVLRREKIVGQVLIHRGNEYFLQSGTNGLRFILKQPIQIEPGQGVEVVGFPLFIGSSITLRAAVVRKTGWQPLPEPVLLQSSNFLSVSQDATRVQLDGRLDSQRMDKNDLVLAIQTGTRLSVARVQTDAGNRLDLPVGGRLRLTGVYVGEGGDRGAGHDNDSFELIVESGHDIQVLERPSWWTFKHTVGVVAALGVVLLVASGWIQALRRQVNERTRKLREEIKEHRRTEVKLATEIDERKRLEVEKELIHKELLSVSRHAGMSEVATGILHNVGNVLNSVNISATLVAEKVQHSKAASIAKVAMLLNEHTTDLGAFMTQNEKGQKLPGYLILLSEAIARERQEVQQELTSLRGNIDHIKAIVAMQQSYVRVSGVVEAMPVRELVEDALKMHSGAYLRHAIRVEREYGEVPPVTTDKHKVLQILVNLFQNAKNACDERGQADKQLTVRIAKSGENRVRIEVADNGMGIPAENLTKIFMQGFTTRKAGHGFGLHSGALAAKELGGSLTAHSDGLGQGATFTLELPLT